MIAERTLTLTDFLSLDLPENQKWELQNGELIEVGIGNLEHELVKVEIFRLLAFYLSRNPIGRAFSETIFTIGEGARSPDVAFVTNEKLATITTYQQIAQFPPDLAIEVISLSETAYYAEAKVDDYLNAGVREVWQVYPRKRMVRVRTAEGPRDIAADHLLESPVLPGFQTVVRDLFPPLD